MCTPQDAIWSSYGQVQREFCIAAGVSTQGWAVIAMLQSRAAAKPYL